MMFKPTLDLCLRIICSHAVFKTVVFQQAEAGPGRGHREGEPNTVFVSYKGVSFRGVHFIVYFPCWGIEDGNNDEKVLMAVKWMNLVVCHSLSGAIRGPGAEA